MTARWLAAPVLISAVVGCNAVLGLEPGVAFDPPSDGAVDTARDAARDSVVVPDRDTGSVVVDASADVVDAPPIACPPDMLPHRAGSYAPTYAGGLSTTVSAFCLDAREVTVAAYRSCVLTGTCAAPGTATGCTYNRTGEDAFSLNCVNFEQATKFCATKGKRLPTEVEWEWAYRNQERGDRFPWGSEVPGSGNVPEFLCWSGSGTARARPCEGGMFARDRTVVGLYDMAGNLSEWTSTPAPSGTGYMVTRGMNFDDTNAGAADRRMLRLATALPPPVGFRCAK